MDEMTREQAVAAHIADCPKHPMAALRQRCERLEGLLREARGYVDYCMPDLPRGHVCGPEGNCDCECVAASRTSHLLARIDAALAGQAGEEE